MSDPMYPLLQAIHDPAQLRRLPRNQLNHLAHELRAFLLASATRSWRGRRRRSAGSWMFSNSG